MSDGFSETQPDSGGIWLWRETEDAEPVELILTRDGKHVEYTDDPDDDDLWVTPQQYWEGTETNKKSMHGWWKKKTE